jgi:hypothetical protein
MEPRRSLAAGNFHQGPRSARVPTQSYSRASPVPIDELDARQLPKRGEQPSHRRCEFDSARPHILGALLDAAVRGLQALPGVRLPSLPRMADFALWATAYGATPWPAGTFAHAYDANRKAAFETNPWQFASEDSWPNAPVGRERPQTCASPPIWPVTISRKKARTGQNIPALSPAGCVACKLLFACWALKYASAVANGMCRTPGLLF